MNSTELTAKELSSKGGKRSWAKLTADQKRQRIKKMLDGRYGKERKRKESIAAEGGN